MTKTYPNIVSVSWGDHLVFGEGDGRLDSPDVLGRRIEVWRDELGAGILHWRQSRSHRDDVIHAARGYRPSSKKMEPPIGWDDFETVPRMAHDTGMKAYLYVSVFDHGWPLPPKKVREVSYHNAMHARHISRQSAFSHGHPEYATADRTGGRQWGVLSLAYPEVRDHLITRFAGLLRGYDFDGLFVCLRSQSRPADLADQYGFNEPVRREYKERHGRDICVEEFDLQLWRDLLGEYLTRFLAELRQTLRGAGLRLAVGGARGEVLGPPLGNATLHWRDWVEQGIVDDLVINQSSSQCPSLWIQLWPMHLGYGYRQNYLDGFNMAPLEDDLTKNYLPSITGSSAHLYVARQWDQRSESEESALLSHPSVSGLAFSSFRHDNPGPIARGDWAR